MKASTLALAVLAMFVIGTAPSRASSTAGASVQIGVTDDAARLVREWRRAHGLDQAPEPSRAQALARAFATGCRQAGGGVLDSADALICL